MTIMITITQSHNYTITIVIAMTVIVSSSNVCRSVRSTSAAASGVNGAL